MEKFGLRTDRFSHNSAIELAIAKEQASALGRAGRALRLSLEQYSKLIENSGLIEKESSPSGLDSNLESDQNEAINEIAKNAWALIMQREFLGFIDGNIEWVTEHYHIPQQALARLGSEPNL